MLRKLVPELGVGDGDQLPGPLADAGAAELGHAVLDDDTVDDVLERGDGGARMQLGDDAGDRRVSRRRMKSTIKDWPCSENMAPLAKSGCPPEEYQYSLPSDSEAHWPSKSTLRVALMAAM